MASVLLDREDLVGRLFFPSDRRSAPPPGATDHVVVVPGARLHLRVHPAPRADHVAVLLFHGNGENACDWDEAAPSFARHGARLLVLDYRGYGLSTGVPTMRRVLEDAHSVLATVRTLFGAVSLVVMGRSLGSAAAWEVAQAAADLAGVVIDSGFTDVDAFTRRRGIDPGALPSAERTVLDPLPKIAATRAPILLLHGEDDQAIAIREAEAAQAARIAQTTLVRLPGHGHNDLFQHPAYWRSLGAFLERARSLP